MKVLQSVILSNSQSASASTLRCWLTTVAKGKAEPRRVPAHLLPSSSSSSFSFFSVLTLSNFLSILHSFPHYPSFSTLAIFLPSGRWDSRWRWYNDIISTLCLPVPASQSPSLSEIMALFVGGTVCWKIGCCLKLFSHRSMKSHYFFACVCALTELTILLRYTLLGGPTSLPTDVEFCVHHSVWQNTKLFFSQNNFRDKISNQIKWNDFLWISLFSVNL